MGASPDKNDTTAVASGTVPNVSNVPPEFHARLAAVMDASLITGPALVAALDGAVSLRTVRRWLAGTSAPGVEALPLLCRALGVTADWLAGITDTGGPTLPQKEVQVP